MSFSVKFQMDPFPDGFPKELNFAEEDSVALESYSDLYENARKNHVPYYTVVVVEAGNHYHTYDAFTFKTQVKNNCDPLNGLPITKIHFFAVKCFAACAVNVYRQCEDHELVFKPFYPFKPESSLKTIFDAILYCPFLTTKSGQLGRIGNQMVIADKVKQGLLFPNINLSPADKKENFAFQSNLTAEERNQETRLWHWCTAQLGSRKAIVKLFEACIVANESREYLNGLLVSAAQVIIDLVEAERRKKESDEISLSEQIIAEHQRARQAYDDLTLQEQKYAKKAMRLIDTKSQ